MSLQTLLERAKELKISDNDLRSYEEKRIEFVSKFPLSNLRNLKLAEYAQGTTKESFCYWLEFKDIPFGIGGGNASKFGIYKARDGQYYTGFDTNKIVLTGKELDDKFSSIKDSILKALEFARVDQIGRIVEIEVPIWRMILQKILSLYYPERFITIGAPEVLLECARDIELKGCDLVSENSIYINYLINQKLKDLPEFKGWEYNKLGSLIWHTYGADSKRDFFIIGSKYEGNGFRDIFPEMLKRSVIATGFATNIDLTGYYNRKHKEITDYLEGLGEESSSFSALKHFLSIKVGDRIAIKSDGSPKGSKGYLSIIGIAEACEKNGKVYEYDPQGLGHIINVKLIKAPVNKEFELGGYGRTIHKLSNQSDIDLIFKADYNYNSRIEKFKAWLENNYRQSNKSPLSEGSISNYLNGIRNIDRDLLDRNLISNDSLFGINNINTLLEIKSDYFALPEIIDKNTKGNYMYSNAFDRYIEFMVYDSTVKIAEPEVIFKKADKMSLNTILYGPPGTGKTYKLKNDYFKLFTDERSTLTLQEYIKSLISAFSWWEIIAASLYDLGTASVTELMNHQLIKVKTDASSNQNIRATIWRNLQAHTVNECTNVNVTDRQSPLFFFKDENSIWEIRKEIVKNESPEIVELLNKSKAYIPQTVEKKRYVFTTFHQSYSYEDFIEGIKPIIVGNELNPEEEKRILYDVKPGIFRQITKLALDDPKNKYAIFIDEINRGNIANIFGELITLIEDDKRLQAKNAIKTTLPYSGIEFSVPDNLYIIGTMNTADRSVEALDTALRRRFSFIEMNPEPNLLSLPEYICEGLNLEKMLLSINSRIEKLLDKDYCIGHSYFMTIKDRKNPLDELREIFINKILPLLQEYFYGDWGKILLVLGQGFVIKKENSVTFLARDQYEDYEEFEDKPIYTFTKSSDWTIETFKGIYE